MSLELPSDLTPYTNGHDQLHSAGAYCLRLGRPLDLKDTWERHYDTEPDYWDRLIQGDEVFYCGGTGDLLSRLEDHRNGDVRTTVLTKVCDVIGLHTAWTGKDYDHATEILEPRLARWLQESRPQAYVHQR